MNNQSANGALYGGNPPQGIGTEPLIINVCLSGNVTSKDINLLNTKNNLFLLKTGGIIQCL